MEKVIIQISPEVVDYLNKLVGLLFEKQYFSFQEFAHQYVNQIYDFIEFDLINFPQKETPPDLRHLGAFYAFFNANKQTTWYLFYEKRNCQILITHIVNNHLPEISLVNDKS